MDETLDFDAFWAGHTEGAKPITFKAFGQVATLNTELPLSDVQSMSRVSTDDFAELLKMLAKLYGQDDH